MTNRNENISFTHDGKSYAAYGWYDEAQGRYRVTGVLVFYDQKNRSGVGTNRRSRWVFRGLRGETKLQRTLILNAASLMFDRRAAQIEEAA